MLKHTLELLFHIIGIGSASGLVVKGDSLFIISDNSGFLYEYHIKENELTKIKLFENAIESTAKKDKADFEAITTIGNELHLFGSGSTANRNRMASYNLQTKQAGIHDISQLYTTVKQATGISDDNFNIEGALYYEEQLFLFQRGNGAASKNGIITMGENNTKPVFHPIALPKIQDIEGAFTDAILVNNNIYFLAAVENTSSTYDDGEVLGTFYGIINPVTLEIEETALLTDTKKLEGICLYKEDKATLSFLLCEDNDTDDSESLIYNLILNK